MDPRADDALLGALPDLVMVVDADLVLRRTTDAWEALLGWLTAPRIGHTLTDLVHPDDIAVLSAAATAVTSRHTGAPVEIRLRTAEGSWRPFEVVARNAEGVDGVDGVVLAARDLRARRTPDGAEVRLQRAVHLSPSMTLLLDRDGTVIAASAAVTRLLGRDLTDVVGLPLAACCEPDSVAELAAALHACTQQGVSLTCEVQMRNVADDGIERDPLAVRLDMVDRLDDPTVGAIVVSGHDVSDLHRAQRTLEHQARHDSLTGLANRSLMLDRLRDAVEHQQPGALLMIGLDRFKPVNDLLGHEAGDELLVVAADRLREVVQPGDLLGRVGGDEFALLTSSVTDRTEAHRLCERIETRLAMPYLLSEGPVRVTASAGHALIDRDATVTGVLADADLSMFESKAGRRGEPERAVPQRDRNANERRKLADDLAAGLQRGEVMAYLQPLVAIRSGETAGLEALVRWQHPELGLLTSSSFLDLAEDAGLDLLLGDVVLRSACGALATVDQEISLGLNLSVTQLADRGLRKRLRGIIAEYGIAPERLMIEITEHATLTRRPGGGRISPERTLDDLKGVGASLCLDDFGTGYSSLTHIRRYPLAAIKIDRSFVAGVCDHPEDRAVIAAMVGMANALDLQVVAEGVETEEQLQAVAQLGCDLVQGYLISYPLPPDQIGPWLAEYGADWRRSRTSAG